MRTEDFSSLTLARYEVCLRACESTTLPNFLGSTLRGAFGHALKRVACQLSSEGCYSCQFPAGCAYSYIFETATPPHAREISNQKDAPRPYILTPPIDSLWEERRLIEGGQLLRFELTLLGGAVNGLLEVVNAIREMAWHGLGAERGQLALQELYAFDAGGRKLSLDYEEQSGQFNLPQPQSFRLSQWIERRLTILPPSQRLKLRFLTRARLRAEGELLSEIPFAQLSKLLWQRIGLLIAVHGDDTVLLDRDAFLAIQAQVKLRATAITTLASALVPQRVNRYSNRQGRTQPHDGVLGEVVYEGEGLAELWPLIVAGELLHVGSGATFGLGKYQIVG